MTQADLAAHLSKQLMPTGAKTIPQAEVGYNALYGEYVDCGFCASGIRVDYTEQMDELLPVNFVWLPEGLMVDDVPCHLCVDCLRINRGLTEEEKESIMNDVRVRTLEQGVSLEVAIEQAILAWCSAALAIAGSHENVRQAVRKQVEGYGEDGEKKIVLPGETGERSDQQAASIKVQTGPTSTDKRIIVPPEFNDDDVLEL